MSAATQEKTGSQAKAGRARQKAADVDLTTAPGQPGNVGPHADDVDTLRDRLMALPRVGHRTIDDVADEREGLDQPISEIDAAVRGRLDKWTTSKAGLAGKALVVWILTGQNAGAQAAKAATERKATEKAKSGSRRARAAGDTFDPRMVDAAAIATETAASKAKPLSQRVTAKEATIARGVILAMIDNAKEAGKFPNAPEGLDESVATLTSAVLGFTSERAFKAFVSGETARGDLKDGAKTGVKALTRGIDSHQVWARKAAAAAFGVMAEAQKAGR